MESYNTNEGIKTADGASILIVVPEWFVFNVPPPDSAPEDAGKLSAYMAKRLAG